MVFKNNVGLLLPTLMSTRDALRVAQTCFYAVPLDLLVEAKGDDQIPVPFSVDGWNPLISMALHDEHARRVSQTCLFAVALRLMVDRLGHQLQNWTTGTENHERGILYGTGGTALGDARYTPMDTFSSTPWCMI